MSIPDELGLGFSEPAPNAPYHHLLTHAHGMDLPVHFSGVPAALGAEGLSDEADFIADYLGSMDGLLQRSPTQTGIAADAWAAPPELGSLDSVHPLGDGTSAPVVESLPPTVRRVRSYSTSDSFHPEASFSPRNAAIGNRAVKHAATMSRIEVARYSRGGSDTASATLSPIEGASHSSFDFIRNLNGAVAHVDPGQREAVTPPSAGGTFDFKMNSPTDQSLSSAGSSVSPSAAASGHATPRTSLTGGRTAATILHSPISPNLLNGASIRITQRHGTPNPPSTGPASPAATTSTLSPIHITGTSPLSRHRLRLTTHNPSSPLLTAISPRAPPHEPPTAFSPSFGASTATGITDGLHSFSLASPHHSPQNSISSPASGLRIKLVRTTSDLDGLPEFGTPTDQWQSHSRTPVAAHTRSQTTAFVPTQPNSSRRSPSISVMPASPLLGPLSPRPPSHAHSVSNPASPHLSSATPVSATASPRLLSFRSGRKISIINASGLTSATNSPGAGNANVDAVSTHG